MEDNTVLDSADYGSATEEIRLTNEGLGYLRVTAKWGAFLAIIGFIFIGLMILGGISFATVLSSVAIPGSEVFGGAAGFAIFYLIFAAIYVYPTLKLFQFSSKCKKAINHSSTNLMTEALGNLKSCYKFIGILMAIILGFYALLFVFGGLGALFMAF